LVLTLLRDPQHRAQCDAYGRRARDAVRHCQTYDELHALVGGRAVHTVVADMAGWARAHLSAFGVFARSDRAGARVVAVHRLSGDESLTLRTLAGLPVDLVAAYPGYHDIESLLVDGSGRGLRSATVELVRRLPGDLSAELGHLLLACIVLGERHTTLRGIGREVAISNDRVREGAALLGYDDFRGLTGDVRLLHALYRIGPLGASEKEAAIAAGYAEAQELTRLCKERVGISPVRFARLCDGFEARAVAFVERVARARDTIR
jgi:hypothetical protein